MIEESQNIEYKESSFEALVQHIQAVGDVLQQDARLVINRNVTTRAWLTGLYIVEYEQNGNDRAKYGTHLLQDLSKRLGGKSYGVTHLRSYRLFYSYYPELLPVIGDYLLARFDQGYSVLRMLPEQIQQSLAAKLLSTQKQQSLIGELGEDGKQQSLIAKLQKGQSLTDELANASEMNQG